MYNGIKRIITLVFGFFLLYLFIVPPLYVSRLADELDLEARAAIDAINEGGDPSPHLYAMRERIDKAAGVLLLFLNHTAVDTVRTGIHALVPMTNPSDQLSGLEAVRTQIGRLSGIESVTIDSLF